MIAALVMFAVVTAVYLAAYGSGPRVADAPKETPAKVCPPHTWTYNADDKLQCTVCLLRAGEVKTDRGSY